MTASSPLTRLGRPALLAAALLATVHPGAAAADCTVPAVSDQAAESPFTWTSQPDAPAAAVPASYRIAVWGDSLTSARNFIDAALQSAGIDRNAVLPSFIQAGLKVPGLSLPLRHFCASAGWKTAYAYREKGSTPTFSEGLLSMETTGPGDALFMDFRFPQPATRVAQLDMVYDKDAPDSSLLLGVSVDGQAEQLIALSRTDAGVLRIAPAEPLSTVRIRLVSGHMRVHGFRPRYQATPRVVLDTFSVPGAQLRGWNYVDPRLPGPPQDYDMILVQYGTNEGAGPTFDAATYADTLRAGLARLRRQHPRARCVLIGPPDRGVVAGQGVDPARYSAIHHRIALAQKAASAAYRCSFWDWQGETGGAGTAVRWTRTTPVLMQPDLTHMTAQGYETSGHMFARSFPFTIPKH